MWIITSLKFKSNIHKFSNKFILYNSFIIFFIVFFDMSKNVRFISKILSWNEERLPNKLAKDIQFFLKNKKKRKRRYGRERYKNLSEEEEQKLVEHRKNI